MIRIPRYLLLLFLLLLTLLTSGIGWLFFTPAGAQTVLRSISRFSPLHIDAARVQGRLASEVTLTDVGLHWPQGEGFAQTVSFRWRPRSLLRGAIVIERLLLQEGTVQLRGKDDGTTEAAADFTFPEIDGLPMRLRVEVAQVQVDRFVVQKDEQDPLQVEHLTGKIAWDAGMLQIEHLDFAGSPGQLTGGGTIDFVRPALTLDLQLLPAGGMGEFDTLAVRTDLQPAPGRRQLLGPFALVLSGAGQERVRLQSTIDWRPDRIALTDVQGMRPGMEGEIRGGGAVMAAAGWPFDLSLHLAGIDLQAETGVHTALSGRLTVEGKTGGWQGRFSLANRVDGWQAGEVTGTFTGDTKGITLADLQGDWLQGKVQGKLAAAWETGWQIEAALTARNLQPAAIVPEWPGRINFDLQGTARGGDEIPLTASIDGNFHDSTLRGRALTGGIAASLRGEEVRIDRLALQGDGFDLHAGGRLQERIDFRATIARLGGLVPGAEGTLRVTGWGRQHAGTLVGEVAAQGEKLSWRDLRLGRGTLEVRRKEKDASFAVETALQQVGWGEYRLATAAVQATGTLEEHRLQLTTTGADLQLQLDVRGGYTQQRWQGELLQLKTGGTLTGRWRLREPAAVQLAEDRLQVSAAHLLGAGEEFVLASADLTFAPLQGWVDAEWQQLDLSRGNPWLADIVLSGQSSGSGRIAWLPDAHLDLRGQLTASGTLTRAGQRLSVRKSTMQVAWNAEGLEAAMEADLAAAGTVSLTAASPHPATFAWPQEGSFATRWRLADLAPLSPWLPETALAGASSGEVTGRWSDAGGMQISGKAEMSGRLQRQTLGLDIRRAQTSFAWGVEGLKADWNLDLGSQGLLAGEATSSEPAQPQLPESGQLRASWEKVDLAVLRPWLPEDLLLRGSLSGETHGEWSAGRRWQLAGAAHIVDGDVQWQDAKGVVTAGVKQGRLSWDWRDEALVGDVQLELETFGHATGTFRLPLAARWPVAIEPAGPVRGSLQAELQEDGLLNTFFPGLIQESRGKLAIDLRLGGTWQTPDYGGKVRLHEADAYLPMVGIHLQQVELTASLAGQEIHIDSLQLLSGDGRITGEGSVRLKQWRLASYELQLRGEKFRAIHLPELELQVGPDLHVSGTAENLVVRGDIRIPTMLVTEKKTAAPIAPSSDVVIVGTPETTKRDLPLKLDVRVRLIFGEHVLVDAEGIDARLEGNLLVSMTGLDREEITAQGEIKVAQGKYSTYGVSLDITRGNILFAGGPIDRPTLDIRAMRTVGEVKAGVKVSGTPRDPRVELFSEPAMTDTDILSYIVLGYPIGREGGTNAGLLMLAAKSLLSKGESAVLQDRLKRTFGLDVLAIDAGNGDVQGSQITIGKYLNPDLYISFGQSLFSNTNEVRMRYNLSRRWQLESSVGEQSAVDLYYKIEFR